MKLEKRKRPRVFEEWVLLTSPKSSVVVCLRAQQQQQRKENKTKKKPKVSGVCQVSLCSLFSSLYLFHCAPTALGFIHTSSPLVFSKRKKKRKKKGGEGREKEEESSAVFTVWYVGGIRLPRPVQPHLPSCLDRNPERGESGSGNWDFCCRRGGGWLCWSPVFSS